MRRAPEPRPHTVRFVAGAACPERIPPPGLPEFAFVGRSNVGKSSLLNRLVGRRGVARVSKTPGRTQQINFFVVDDRILFVDLPGYGFARVPLAVREQWRPLVETYLHGRPTLCGVAVLVDLRRGLQDDDALLLDYLAAEGRRALVVATKADKLAHGARARAAAALRDSLRPHGATLAVVSSVTGEGIADVWRHVERCRASRSAR